MIGKVMKNDIERILIGEDELHKIVADLGRQISEDYKDKNLLMGYTEGNKLVNFTGPKSIVGQIVNVKITDAKTWSLDGEYVE